jgi:hypothetical protein
MNLATEEFSRRNMRQFTQNDLIWKGNLVIIIDQNAANFKETLYVSKNYKRT